MKTPSTKHSQLDTHNSSPGPASRARSRIDAAFDRLRAKGEKALITYIMAGDPSLQETETLVLELEKAGADLIELGVPFSDPIADGPVIQQAADRALRSGTTLRRILDLVERLRRRTQVPLVLMAYYNTIHAMGPEDFCRRAVEAGVDGLIVPDMPPEEAGPLAAASGAHGGPALVYLLAPTSTAARRAVVAKRSRGFLYYVSLTGITGARLSDLDDVKRNVERIRRVADLPVAVGFGIATPEEAARVSRLADGVIVGSAIVKQVAEHQQGPELAAQVGRFAGSLKRAMTAAAAPAS